MARRQEGIELQGVVHLSVRREELRRRMLARAEREGRSDDTPSTIDHRLDVYANETEPLVDYYARRGLVVEVDGERPADDVFSDIVAGVDKLLAEPGSRGEANGGSRGSRGKGGRTAVSTRLHLRRTARADGHRAHPRTRSAAARIHPPGPGVPRDVRIFRRSSYASQAATLYNL